MRNYENITKEELIIAYERLQQLNSFLVSSHKKDDQYDLEEKKLHKKDLVFRKLSANVPDLIFQFTRRTDGSYCFPIASAGIVNIFGCSPEDVLNDFAPIAKVLYPEDAERVINDIEYSAAHLTDFTCEFRVQLPGKEIQWILSKSTPEKLPDGSVTWYGFSADITEQKKAEEKLKKAALLLQSSIESPKDMIIFSIDKNFNYLYFNECHRLAMLHAYGQEVKIGMNLLACITSEEDSLKAKINLDKALNGESHITIQEFGDIEKSHYETRYNPIFNDKNEIIGTTAFSSDITARKQAEKKMQDQNVYIKMILDNLPIGIATNEIDSTKATYMNRKFSEIYGWPEDDFPSIGEFFEKIFPDVAYRQQMQTKILADISSGDSERMNWDNLKITTKAGEPRIVYAHNIPLVSQNIMVSTVQDITERKKSEEILEESYTLIKIAGEKAKLGGWSVNIGENRVYWSAEVASIHERPPGYSPSVEEGINFYAPEWRSKIKKIFVNCVGKGISFDEEMQIITESGKRVWVRTMGEAVKDSSGKIFKVQGAFQDITERKIAEEAVRESEAKLKRILVNLQDAYLQADLKGKITFVNPTAVTLFGYDSIEEMLGLPAYKLYADKKDRDFLINRLSNSKKVTDYVLNGLRKDNSTFWVSISVQYTLDNEGRINGTEGVVRDISDRKQTEEQLLKLSQAVEQSPASIILTDTKGNVEYANLKTLKITGYTLEEIKGKNPRIFSSGEKPKSEYKNLWETILSGKEWRGEFHNKKKSGELYWELASISPIINEKGEIINFLAVKEDITERKQILDDLIVAKEHAEESEIRLLEAQKITKVGSWETDLSNFKVIWSDETYRIFEISSTIFQGTHQAFLNFVHPDDKKKVDDAFIKSFETKAYNSIEHRIITAKGTIKYVEERWKIVFNDQENSTRAIGTCQDITERKLAEQELKEAKEKAEESDRLKSAFLANMSHEIRTPMNGILGFAGLLKEPGLSDEKQQKYIKIIEKSGDRMLNIINDIVDISKIESGTMKIYNTETDINEKIENLYQFFKPEAEAKKIQFTVEKTLPKNEALIKTDSEKVYAVLSNLLKNAIKFTNEGKIAFGVGVTNSSKGQKQLQFYIKDTGIGIPKNRQEAIFERFIQADVDDKMAIQGAGLGLSISKAYVEMLGGKIWVESEEGIGSAFYFTIPWRKKTEKIIKQNSVRSTKIDEKAANLKILIAEDDEASSIYLSLLAEEFSSEILTAKNGFEAVEIYKHNPDIDLILMDMKMPYLNGYEATIEIRELNKKVIIIAQTAFSLSYDRQKVIDAGCNDYISKPISMNNLTTLIRKYFD